MPKQYKVIESDAHAVCEPQARWGGQWTEEKLDAFGKYVKSYLTIMKKHAPQRGWELFYFDAFAGSGSRDEEMESESTEKEALLFDAEEIATVSEQATYQGAAERVIGTDVDGFGFDYYYFVDKDNESLSQLETRLNEKFPEKHHQMAFRPGDANDRLRDLVDYAVGHPDCAFLVLLDPFGMQLKWSTIQELRKIRHIDLWILVPSGVIINRLLTRSGKILCPQRMEETFGMPITEIQDYFYEQVTEPSLFGEIERQQKRDNAIGRIAQLYLKLLRKEFSYVIKEPLVMRNTNNCPIFHFVFASHNQAAADIASAIVGKKNRGK